MLTDVTDFCRLFLLRHPELGENDRNRAVGAGDASLSRRGKAATVAWLTLLQAVELDAAVAADQAQCREPAAALAATKGVELEVAAELRDQRLGRWEGALWSELARTEPDRVRDFFADFGEISAPDGESLGAAIERFLAYFAARRQAWLGRAVAIVASGAMISGFTAAMLGMRLSRAVCLSLPHAGLGIVDVYDNGVRITAWNPTALAE